MNPCVANQLLKGKLLSFKGDATLFRHLEIFSVGPADDTPSGVLLSYPNVRQNPHRHKTKGGVPFMRDISADLFLHEEPSCQIGEIAMRMMQVVAGTLTPISVPCGFRVMRTAVARVHAES